DPPGRRGGPLPAPREPPVQGGGHHRGLGGPARGRQPLLLAPRALHGAPDVERGRTRVGAPRRRRGGRDRPPRVRGSQRVARKVFGTGRGHRVLRGPRGPGHRVARAPAPRSEEHTSELQSRENLVCRLLLEKKKKQTNESNRKIYTSCPVHTTECL